MTPEIETQIGASLARIVADRGYRGHHAPPDHKFKVYISGQRRRVTETIKRELRSRSAVEPVIGHAKAEHRMGRNYLAGTRGDAANAVLAAAGYNFRRLLEWLALLLSIVMAALKIVATPQGPFKLARERSSRATNSMSTAPRLARSDPRPGKQRGLLVLAEPAGDKGGERVQRLASFGAGGRHRDRRSGARAEGEDAHDRIAPNRLAAARDPDVRVKSVHALHKFGGGARVQALPVDDLQVARQRPRKRRGRGTVVFGAHLAHFPSSTLLAMVMYLRPASRASTTA